MRIAFINDALFPYSKGGREKRLWDIAVRLADRGHEIHIYTLNWWKGKKEIIKEKVHLHGICGVYPFYSGERRSIKEALFFTVPLLPEIIKEKFDIIDCDEFPFFPAFVAKITSMLHRTPFVITWHEVWGDYWYEYFGPLGLIGKIIEFATARLPGHILSVSEHNTYRLEKILKVKLTKITTIPNGIDLKIIKNVRPSTQKFDILFAGRLIKDKNVDVLIKAIALVKHHNPEVRCGIIGDGPAKEKLTKLVNALDLSQNIFFLGFIKEHNRVISKMKSSKIFVLPSSREGFGIVVLEAMACRLPVITANCENNAAKELIVGNGYVCELDEGEIAEKIERLLKDKSLYEKLSKEAFKSSKKYDWGMIIKKLGYFYQARIAGKGIIT